MAIRKVGIGEEQTVDVELEPGEVLGADGEIVPPDVVEQAYTREGRRAIGKEYPNPTPMAPPIGWHPQEPIHEMIARMVRNGVHEQLQRERGEELDSPEEADDFDVGDDFDPEAPYEHDFEPTMPWPASRAVEELERQINEHRNQSRIVTLRQELEALSNGRPWPPEASQVRGGGGAEPPSGEPNGTPGVPPKGS